MRLDNRAPRIVDFRVQPFPLPPTMPYEVEASTGYLKTIRDWCQRQNPPIPNCVEPYASIPEPIVRAGRQKYGEVRGDFKSRVGLLVSYRAEEDYAEALTAQATFTADGVSSDGGTLVSDFGTFRSTYTDLPPYMEDPNNPGQPDPNVVKTVEVRLTVDGR